MAEEKKANMAEENKVSGREQPKQTKPTPEKETKKADVKPEEKCATNQERRCECVAKEEYIKLKYQFSEFMNKFKDYEKEFENYKRRTREEIKEAKEEGVAKAIKAIIPALDTFKKARMIITDKSSLSGINLIEKSILNEFEKLGVKPIKCKGEKFDPELHNAVMLVEDETIESGTVVEEFEAGYTLGGKVIKFSQVSVAK